MPIDVEIDDLEITIDKLKAREENFKSLETLSNLGSWEIDLKTQKSIWSDQSYKIYGLDKETTTPNLQLFFSHVLPEDLEKVQNALKDVMSTGNTTSLECRIKRSDGEIVHLRMNGKVLYDEDGTPAKLIGTSQNITELISLERHAKEISDLIEYSSNEIYILNYDTLEYMYANKGACDAVGYTLDELKKLNVFDINPLLTQEAVDNIKNYVAANGSALNRSVHKRKDGSQYSVQAYLHPLTYNAIEAFVIFDTDISQIMALEAKHKKQSKIIEHINDSIISTDLDGTIVSWNLGTKFLLGYSESDIIGKNISDIYDSSNEMAISSLLSKIYTQGKCTLEAYLKRIDSIPVICEMSFSVLKDEEDQASGLILYSKDITKKKETEELIKKQSEKLNHQAHHDTLTNLPNRTLFQDRLTQIIASSSRNNEEFALLFLDLDQFKKINDSLGHHIGDKLLIKTAQLLKKSLRAEDTLARLGGDEFTIILKDINGVRGASKVAQKISAVLRSPIEIDGHSLYISSSIGISLYPQDTTNDYDLIKFADTAMYKAKDNGRDNFQFYSSEMTDIAFRRVQIENNLRTAIEEDNFEVYYQPQYDANKNEITGMEALVRWNHPELGFLLPDQFLPIAKDSRLILQIDKIVTKKAMKQFVKWYKNGFNPGVLALNLTIQQLDEKNFILDIINTMNETGFKPAWLELEVTESQVMSNPEDSIEKLNKISNIGIEIAIDDFGTGYSSLSYLKKLPLDKLKIDRSFVRDLPHSEDDTTITKTIIALAKSLNLNTVAEGVETKEQKDFLLQNGCTNFQGYYYAAPMNQTNITKLLKSTINET